MPYNLTKNFLNMMSIEERIELAEFAKVYHNKFNENHPFGMLESFKEYKKEKI